MASRLFRSGQLFRPLTQRLTSAGPISKKFISTPAYTPSLFDLQHRWEKLPIEDQQEIILQLEDRMKLPWKELTEEEKKAAFYISYGPWGPRRPALLPGEGKSVAFWVAIGFFSSVAIFVFLHSYVLGARPKTLSREWQEKSNILLKKQNAEPFTGINAIQSAPTGLKLDDDEEDEDDDE